MGQGADSFRAILLRGVLYLGKILVNLGSASEQLALIVLHCGVRYLFHLQTKGDKTMFGAGPMKRIVPGEAETGLAKALRRAES